MVSLLASVRALAQAEPFVEEASVELPESRSNLATELALRGELLVVADPGAVVGASLGAFYSLSRAQDGWVYEATVTASDGAMSDAFAASIALDGETVLVGAPGTGLNGITQIPGSAYVFVRSDGGWVEQQELTAPDGAIDDHFGESVALSGDIAVVSAPGKPFDANENQGAIYVFVRSGTTWTFERQIIAPSAQDGDFFGRNIAVDGETLVVGVRSRPGGDGGLRQGVAFVYVRSGGTWQLHQTLTAPDGEASDQFGAEVVLDGDTAIVCAPLADWNEYGNHGAGYVFTRTGTTWTLEQKISTSYNDSSIQRIGETAALEGDTALLSAPAYHGDRGGVFVFVRSGTTWSEQQELRPAVFTQNFGQRPALSGNFAVISAFNGVFSFERAPAPGGANSDGGDASAAPATDASSDSDAADSNERARGDARESGGCGCRIHGRSGDSGGALLVLAAAYVAAQRRRPSLKERCARRSVRPQGGDRKRERSGSPSCLARMDQRLTHSAK